MVITNVIIKAVGPGLPVGLVGRGVLQLTGMSGSGAVGPGTPKSIMWGNRGNQPGRSGEVLGNGGPYR